MPATPYDVIIDGKGYIIKDGTYAAGKQQLAADQFRTGDISYETLRDQQAWAQSDWRGGLDFYNENQNTQFSSSLNIDIPKDKGSIQLSLSMSATVNSALYPGLSAISSFKDFYSYGYFFGNGSNVVYYNSAGTVQSAANLVSAVESVVNFDQKLWATTPSISTLWASSNPSSSTGWSASLNSANGVTFHRAVSYNKFLYLSDGFNKLYAYDGTGSTGLLNVIASPKWQILNMAVYAGRLYMGCVGLNNPKIYALRAYDGSTDWTVYQWNDVNIGGGTGTNQWLAGANNSFKMMVEYNGKLYFNLDNYESSTQIYTFDSNEIKEDLRYGQLFGTSVNNNQSTVIDYAIMNGSLYVLLADGYITTGTPFSVTMNLYVTQGTFWYKQFYTGTSITDGTFFPSGTTTLNQGVLLQNSDIPPKISMYINNTSSQGLATKSYITPQFVFANYGQLDSVIFDMDLFSLNKKVTSFEIYHSALYSGTFVKAVLTTYGNSSVAATSQIVNSIAGTTQTIMRPTNAVGKNFQYQIILSSYSGSNRTPVVNDVVARWVLEPEDKGQWTFDIICVDNLQLNDGSFEKRTGSQIRKDLEAARKKAITSFTDINGTTYNATLSDTDNRGVIIKDIQFKGPYDMSDKGIEFIATVVLVQA